MKKTKIICTLGPASDSEYMIEKLIKAGMNVARINFSHGNHKEQREKIKNFNKARDNLKVAVALLMDTKGPEIRVKDFINGCETLEEEQKFTLTIDDAPGTNARASITYKELYRQVKQGDVILVDDGKITLTVVSVEGKDIVCKVLKGGIISDKKGINVPGIEMDVEYLSAADKADILFGIENDVDYIAASFVRRETDVKILRNFLECNGGSKIKIIAKIENREGIENFERILEVADGIMVARGDMGVEIDFENLPSIQKRIIRDCCAAGKVSITATQMLESMIENPSPTRAEITDVANAVYDGTSAVMLSGETAVGDYPLETVEAMSKIIQRAEQDVWELGLYSENSKDRRILKSKENSNVSNAVGHAACQAAEDIGASAILAVTNSGYTAEKISKYKPQIPIIAATPNRKTFHQQALTWGVYPIITKHTDKLNYLMFETINKAKQLEFVKKEDWLVICAGVPLQETGKTNLIKIEKVK